MNYYNKEQIKKTVEKGILDYFLEAYEEITGQLLEVHSVSERPDFICIRKDGSEVGIELVQVRRGHPNDIFFNKYIEKQDYMNNEYALELIQLKVIEKEKKRNELDWKLPLAAILLIELADIPLSYIKSYITPNTIPDMYLSGFGEIWLIDSTGTEAYDNVELFCVQPAEWSGYYPREIKKP
ncbi:MAG: hypothetical protein GX625_08330 [Clostridiaceae bacterium]|uniref:Hypothetical cytosolic protein n=1 Tax=Syntrophus aciditrophicus (strain SB) TaxID=56780 RepID=Q2LV86_SYNAS|nr:hypothetical protein [Syntrophus aciditrophicus]ABC77995.1 hypothetical cytosolic protein [Syntrophus aciditrophicus SB]NLE25334.1 hypothetical protein [Clostridiaceae bacterium]